MRVSLTKKDVIWSYIGIIMSMGSNILMLPIIIYYLDTEMLGLWYVFISIGAISLLFDFGFCVTFARNITYCWSGANNLQKEGAEFVVNKDPDFYLMKKVLVACKKIYFILASVVLFLLLTIGTWYIMYIARDIDNKSYLIAWFIYSLAVSLNLYYCYYLSFLRGVGAIEESNKNTIIARLIQIISTVLFLITGLGIIGVCLAYFIYGSMLRILGKKKFYNYQKIGEKLNLVNQIIPAVEIKELIVIIWYNAWRDGLVLVSNYLSNQATIVICSLYLSLSETGKYSVGVQIAMAIAAISGTMYSASQPVIQASYVNNDFNRIKKVLSIVVTSLIFIFIIGIFLSLIFALPLLKIIKPEIIVSNKVLLGLCIYHFILKLRDCYTTYFSCTNRIPYLPAFLLSSVLCMILSILLTGVWKFGLWGLIFAQIISQLYNVLYWPMLAHKEIQTSSLILLREGVTYFYKRIKSNEFCKLW